MRKYYEHIANYFANVVIPPDIDGYTLEIICRELYYTMYGIHNLDDTEHPLALVRYTNADTVGDLGSVAELINNFRIFTIHEKYGLNLTEYMNLPIDIIELLTSRNLLEKENEEIIKRGTTQAMEIKDKKI